MPSLDDFLIVFPDTNFFLECRTPEECPWGQITSVAEFALWYVAALGERSTD